MPATPGKPAYSGQNLALDVMAGCDSVACVVEQFQSFSMDGTWNGQYLFGDRFGASAIIEPLAVIPKTERFQVATNFFQSEVPPAETVTLTSVNVACDTSWNVQVMLEPSSHPVTSAPVPQLGVYETDPKGEWLSV